MRKAVVTGLFTGVIISTILIGGTFLRRFLPDTFTANLVFLTLFFGSIVTVLWLSLHHYCKKSAVKWKSLTTSGIISSVIAALLVSVYSFLYGRFSDPIYLDEIMQFSKQKWQKTNHVAETFIGSLFRSPFDLALNNFRDLMVLLIIISIVISIVFYLINRNRVPRSRENHELIF
jgi:hypothetical protein